MRNENVVVFPAKYVLCLQIDEVQQVQKAFNDECRPLV